MGRDKAKLRLGNRTMVSQIRSMARRTGLPVRVIRRDLVPRCGPLGGIYTGLLTTEKQGVIFLACDMPFVGVDLLHKLIEIGGGRYSVFTKAEASVGFPVLIVRRDFAMIIKQLGERQFSIQSLARRLKGRTLRGNPSLKHQLINVNTLVDWQSAKQLWTSR